MLTIVIKKPIQFTMVSAVPLYSAIAFFAINVDNSGESAITTIPQKKRNPKNKISEELLKINGNDTQHKQDKHNEIVAIFFAPNALERCPLNTQASPPIPMIKKENNDVLNESSGCCVLYLERKTGTKAQKVYNSNVCPKYPIVTARNFLFLNTFKKAEKFV